MVIKYRQIPKQGARTQTQGWSQKDEWQVKERAEFVDRINNRILTDAHTIIDIFHRQIIKTRFTDQDEQTIISYFFDKFNTDVTKAIRKYMANKANIRKTQS
jgi:hypothetical protein